MEYLLQFIANFGQDPQLTRGALTLIIGLTAALGAVSVILIVFGLSDPIRKRLATVGAGRNGQTQKVSGFHKVADSVAPISQPRKEAEKKKTAHQLVMAGYRSANAFSTFYATKLLLGLVMPALVLYGATYFPHFSTIQIGITALFASFVGLMAPTVFLERKVAKRQKKILNSFPDALDLLVACTEAGLGLNNALQRVAEEVVVSSPELAEELELVNAEIRAGIDRKAALHGLYERTGLDDIRGLISLFSQTMRFGTSIADALRIYAEEFRDKRMQRAEEQAAKLGTKMIFPMVLFIFPAFFIVAIGPAVMKIIDAFQSM